MLRASGAPLRYRDHTAVSASGIGDDRTDVNATWQTLSGDAIVVYGKGATSAYTRTWNGASWSGDAVARTWKQIVYFEPGSDVVDESPSKTAAVVVDLEEYGDFQLEKGAEIIRDEVSDILTVSETGIIDAMELTWKYLRILIEPSSATVIAAILEHPDRFEGKKVAAIVSGGNIDLDKLPF